jgi:hypothetical protein
LVLLALTFADRRGWEDRALRDSRSGVAFSGRRLGL